MDRDQRHRKGCNPRVRPGQKAVRGRFGLWRFEAPRSVWQNDEMVTKRTAGGILSGFGVTALVVALLSFGGGEAEMRYDTIAPPSSTEPRPVMEPPRRPVEVSLDPIVSTTTVPDVSDVDFALLQQAVEEDARISRQMEIDEARMIYGKCGEWKQLAEQIGWPAEEWPTLSYVLYRESRCNTDSWNKTDPASGSRGLLQINGYWCRPSQWTDKGWLQDMGILNTCEDLFDAETNLRAGLAVWLYGVQKHGCGWGPWAQGC